MGRLNRKPTGWANYFCLGPVSPAYHAIDTHVRQRLRRWLCKKHKVAGKGTTRFPDQVLHEDLGLVRLAPARTTFRGRQHECLSESRVRKYRMLGSMSGMWKRSHGLAHRAPPTERGGKSDA